MSVSVSIPSTKGRKIFYIADNTIIGREDPTRLRGWSRRVWAQYGELSTVDYFLARFDGKDFETYHDGLLHNYISRLTASPEGGIWIVYHNFFDETDCHEDSCPKGTSYFDGTSFHHYSIHNGLPQWSPDFAFTDVSWIVYSSKYDDIYVNCHTFFVKFQGGEWKVITEKTPRGILIEGPDKNLWQGFIGTGQQTNHLMYFDGFHWIEYNVNEVRSTILDTYYDGSYPFPYTSSMAVTPDGTVWMGMSRGILKINPDSLPSTVKTNVEPDTLKPSAIEVNCFPNPFNQSTNISFDVSYMQHVEMDVYSMTGQHIKKILSGNCDAGRHTVPFNGSNLSSGVYLYRLVTKDYVKMGKMMFVK